MRFRDLTPEGCFKLGKLLGSVMGLRCQQRLLEGVLEGQREQRLQGRPGFEAIVGPGLLIGRGVHMVAMLCNLAEQNAPEAEPLRVLHRQVE